MGEQTDDEMITEIEDIGHKHLADAQSKILGALDANGKEMLNAAIGAMKTVKAVGANANHSISTALDDDQVPMEGRKRVATETFEKARSQYRAATDQSLAAVTTLKRKLESLASPKPPKDSGTLAMLRDEVRMTLEAAKDPFTAAAAIAQGEDRDMAAVLLSRWGQTLLRTHHVDDASDALRAAAVKGAAQHGTPEERRAANALAGLIDLQKAHVGAVQGASSRLQAAGDRLGLSI